MCGVGIFQAEGELCMQVLASEPGAAASPRSSGPAEEGLEEIREFAAFFKFAAIETYMKDPNPDAVIIFVADHISIPADVRRMEMQDKERYQRIRETMGQYCGIVELARVEEGEAMFAEGDCAVGGGEIDGDAEGFEDVG